MASRSAYRWYKHKTNAYLEWLAQAAIQHGYQIPDHGGQQATPQHSQSQKATFKIASQDFATMAQCITSCRATIPDWVLRFAKDAIALREKATEWHEENTTPEPEKEASNSRHRTFTLRLRQSVEILQQSIATSLQIPPETTRSTSKEPHLDPNRFSVLEIQDSPHESTNDHDIEATTKQEPSIVKPDVSIEVDDTEEQDEVIRVYCLLKDISSLREWIWELWTKRLDGVEFMVTALLTDVAFFFIILRTEEVRRELPWEVNFETILKNMFSEITHEKSGNKKGEEKDVTKISLMPFDSSFSADCDMGLMIRTVSMLNAIRVALQDSTSHQEASETLQEFVEDFLEIASFEGFDLSEEEKRHATKSFIQDFETLSVLFSDVQYNVYSLENVMTPEMFTVFLKDSFKHPQLSSNFIIMLTCYLGTMQREKDLGRRGVTVMRHFGSAVQSSFLKYLRFSTPMIKGDDKWPELVQEGPKVFSKRLLTCIHGGKIDKYCQSNPILGGLMAAWSLMGNQAFGFSITKNWLATVSIVYLYTAARLGGVQVGPWPDMDRYIDLLTPKSLFFGDTPRSLEDCEKRWGLLMGLTVQEFAPNRRHRPLNEASLNLSGRTLKDSTTPVMQALRDRYLGGNLKDTLSQLEALLTESGKKPFATDMELLGSLRVHIAAELPKMAFDHLSFHERCVKMNREVDEAVHAAKLRFMGMGYIDYDDKAIRGSTGVILALLDMMRKTRRTRDLEDVLGKVAAVIRRWVAREGSVEVKKMESLLRGPVFADDEVTPPACKVGRCWSVFV